MSRWFPRHRRTLRWARLRVSNAAPPFAHSGLVATTNSTAAVEPCRATSLRGAELYLWIHKQRASTLYPCLTVSRQGRTHVVRNPDSVRFLPPYPSTTHRLTPDCVPISNRQISSSKRQRQEASKLRDLFGRWRVISTCTIPPCETYFHPSRSLRVARHTHPLRRTLGTPLPIFVRLRHGHSALDLPTRRLQRSPANEL
jgi:hypothetical protein